MDKLLVAYMIYPDGSKVWIGMESKDELDRLIQDYKNELTSLGRELGTIEIREPTESELETVAIEEAERQITKSTKH
jgi:hypothetical protein